nr:hypothetical protein [Tanacetum cinerariifolium]
MSGGVRFGKRPALEANEAIVQHNTPPLPIRTLIPETTKYQRVVQHEDERVIEAKGKLMPSRTELRGKDESEGDDSTRIGSETHHSTSPINTVIPENIDPGASGGGLILESVNRTEDDVDHGYHNEGGIEVNSPPIDHSLEPQHLYHSNHDEQ